MSVYYHGLALEISRVRMEDGPRLHFSARVAAGVTGMIAVRQLQRPSLVLNLSRCLNQKSQHMVNLSRLTSVTLFTFH